MMNQMNYYAYNGGMVNGMGYNQAYQRPQMNQPLSAEEINLLADKGGAFTTKVTQEEMLKAYCTHKKNGQIVAVQDVDGQLRCPICGEVFHESPLDKATIEAHVEEVINDMQNIKLAYLDMGVETARQYFPIIPLLRKLPQLAVMAENNYNKYNLANDGAFAQNNGLMYGFNAYNNILAGNGGFGGMNYYNPANAGMPMGQPVMQPMMGQPMMPQGMYQQNYDPNAMVNPMNTGAYPMQAPMQAQNMMAQQPAPVMGNEFGTYGNPAMGGMTPVAPQMATQQAPVQAQPVATNPVVPAAQPQAVAAQPAAGTPQVDVGCFSL